MTINTWNTDELNANGELLIGNGSNRPTAATITAGSANLTVTNGAGSITIATVATTSQWVKITTSTASSSSSIDFTSLSATYQAYRVVAYGIQPASDGVSLYFRTSTDNGSTFDNGSTDYSWTRSNTSTSSNSASADRDDTEIEISNSNLGNNTNEFIDIDVTIWDPAASAFTSIMWSSMQANSSSATRYSVQGGGNRKDTTAVDAVRFFMSSGNISVGEFVLYGIEA